MADYLFVDMIAEKWGVSKSWVYRLLRAGRVEGAYFKDSRWSVPANAKKPENLPAKRIMRLRSKKLKLPERLPLSLCGGRDRLQACESFFEECAEYTMSLVDLSPGSGEGLFAALAYPHMTAIALPLDYISYSWLYSLKNAPEELYSNTALMLFEYFAITPEARRDYFTEIRNKININEKSRSEVRFASYLLFTAITSAGGELVFGEDGRVVSSHGRRKSEPLELRDDIMRLSSLLSRAEIIDMREEYKLEIPEYCAVKVSENQLESGEYKEECNAAERVLVS